MSTPSSVMRCIISHFSNSLMFKNRHIIGDCVLYDLCRGRGLNLPLFPVQPGILSWRQVWRSGYYSWLWNGESRVQIPPTTRPIQSLLIFCSYLDLRCVISEFNGSRIEAGVSPPHSLSVAHKSTNDVIITWLPPKYSHPTDDITYR